MAKGPVKCKKVFINKDGSESAHASPSADALEFRFVDGGTHSVKLNMFNSDILSCLAWNGVSQKLGDGYASDASPADAEESFEALLEQISGENGIWVKNREGVGPSPTLIFEAVKAAKEAAGMPYDDAATREKYKTKESREHLLSLPEIKAHYERLKLERQQARVAEAQRKAAEAPKTNALADI